MVMWFSASTSSYCTEPHNHLIGNRNRDMAYFEVQIFISVFLSWLKSDSSHMHIGVGHKSKNRNRIQTHYVGFFPSRKESLHGYNNFIGLKLSGNS